MAKEKGQIAFEAFYTTIKDKFRSGDFPTWDKLSESEKNSWREAVKAVLPDRKTEVSEKTWELFKSKYDVLKTPDEIKSLAKKCQSDAGILKDVIEGII